MITPFVKNFVERFAGLDDIETIRRKVTVIPDQVRPIRDVLQFEIQAHIRALLGRLYIPTSTDIDILQRLVRTARAHAQKTYQDERSYFLALYQSPAQFESEQQYPLCLTGPAGVGKSSLLKAVSRLFPGPEILDLGAEHGGAIRTCSHWSVAVQAHSSFSTLMAPLVSPGERPVKRQHDAVASAAKIAWKSGVSLLLLDEMQFLTQSSTANTLATKLLYSFSYIGVPFLFVANYSLGHVLKRRPEQDRQRLLSHPLVMLPSTFDSADWLGYVDALQRVLGDSLAVDLRLEAATLHQFTAGLKRLVVQMLSQAYERAWQRDGFMRQVTMDDLCAVYDSTAYSVSRAQVAAMQSPYRRRAAEYECPFPLPAAQAEDLAKKHREERMREITAALIRDSVPRAEREAATAGRAQPPTPPQMPPHTPLQTQPQATVPEKKPRRPKRTPVTVDSLLTAHKRSIERPSGTFGGSTGR